MMNIRLRCKEWCMYLLARIRSTSERNVIPSRLSINKDVLDILQYQPDTYNNQTNATTEPYNHEAVFQPNGAPISIAKSNKLNVIEFNQNITHKKISEFTFIRKSFKES
jgi:hypothetical protein